MYAVFVHQIPSTYLVKAIFHILKAWSEEALEKQYDVTADPCVAFLPFGGRAAV